MAEIIDTSSQHEQKVGVRFTDNQSGIGANVTIHLGSWDVNYLLANTADAKDGYLTSIELQSNFQGVDLYVYADGNQIGEAVGNGNNQCSFKRTPINELSINLVQA